MSSSSTDRDYHCRAGTPENNRRSRQQNLCRWFSTSAKHAIRLASQVRKRLPRLPKDRLVMRGATNIFKPPGGRILKLPCEEPGEFPQRLRNDGVHTAPAFEAQHERPMGIPAEQFVA